MPEEQVPKKILDGGYMAQQLRLVEAASLNLKPQRLKVKSLIPEPSPEPLNPKAYNPTLGIGPEAYTLYLNETSAGNASVLGRY